MTAPARSTSLSPLREARTVPLDCITGRSPHNCRPESDDDDVADLEASIGAVGLIYPLLVSPVPGPKLRFWVDAGGRRLAALRRLAAAGRIEANLPVPCEVIRGEECVARETSLAENIHRELHPVDQCVAFAAMIATGMSEAEIADHFGITARQVRQRLRLVKLSPRVREAWRAGTLTTEQAQAMTVGATHEAQDAVLEKSAHRPSPEEIRRQLRGEAVAGDCEEARYVGIDAYVAAGGTLDENLFEDHPLVLDAALLERLAREKMMRDGEKVLAETGLSFCMIAAEVERAYAWPRVEPEYTAAEMERLREIEDADFDDDTAEPAAYGAWVDRCEDERAAIEARAIQRACTPEIKARAGIFLDLTAEGGLEIEYGVMRPAEPPASPGFDGASAPVATPAKGRREKPDDPVEAAAERRGVRDVLEAAIAAALERIVGTRPDLALLVAVARFGGTYQSSSLVWSFGLAPFAGAPRPELLGSLDAKGFDHAVAICMLAPLADLTVAFSRIVAGSIRVDKHAPLTALDTLMLAFARRGAALPAAFRACLDYEAYFEAATSIAVLAALEAMSTDNIDRKAKKPALAALAASDARKKGWLPYPFSKWADFPGGEAEAAPPAEPVAPAPAVEAPADDRPLAAAMADAIDRDLSSEAGLTAWLDETVTLTAGGEVKAGALYESYKAAAGGAHVGIQAFGRAVAARGIAKRRTAAGTIYVDVARRGDPAGGSEAISRATAPRATAP